VHMVRNQSCGENFELKKQLCVNAVFEHLGLTASGSSSRKGRLFVMRRHVPQRVFDRANLRVDFFTIHSTFLRDAGDVPTGAPTRVIERRGRVGGVWTYTMSRALSQGPRTSERYIDETRIGGRMYAELLSESEPSRRTVKRKQRVFVCYVPEVGRDVAHRVIEVVEAQHDAQARQRHISNGRRSPAPPPPEARLPPRQLSFGDAAGAEEERTPIPEEGSFSDNIELLNVDVDDGSPYEPPEFLRAFIDHEVLDADERARYSLRALSAAPTDMSPSLAPTDPAGGRD
jgi:hypothetical protein